MHKFLLRLKIRGCKEVFIEGQAPGIIALEEVTFDAEAYRGAIAVALVRQEDLLIKNVIEVLIEEIT